MNTTIYLIRHSEGINPKPNYVINSDILQVQNEKWPLSVKGEKKAEKLSLIQEMKNIDVVISSNYVRAMSTAKYIAEQNNKELNIIEPFGERKFGITSWDQLPTGFEKRQIEEPTFKMENGESQKEVAERMYKALTKVLTKNKGKRIAIVSHATAITFLFMKLGQYKDNCIYFKDNVIIDKNFRWNAPEVFQLQFTNDELITITNIKNY